MLIGLAGTVVATASIAWELRNSRVERAEFIRAKERYDETLSRIAD
jgi:ABC-type nickel/cobalt efflux system permease component RcnA